jgi:hypothetical protein
MRKTRYTARTTRTTRIYYPNEFGKLLRFCWMTTNLEENEEKFLFSISDSKTITQYQMQYLHELAVKCAEANSYQRCLHDLKFLKNDDN